MAKKLLTGNQPVQDITSSSITLKTAVTVAIYLCSLVGLYYTMKFRVDTLQDKVIELEQNASKLDASVTIFRLDEITKNVSNLGIKIDAISNLLNKK